MMEFGLVGKTVIVTGGASNIGHGIVMAFAKEGANVVIADIDESQALKTAEFAEKLGGGKTLVVITDVTKHEDCEAMVKKTLDEFSKIDVLINNVGGVSGYLGSFRDMPRDVAFKTMALNFWGQFDCTKAVVEHMISRKSGKIINISSAAGLGGIAQLSMYAASKAAVINFTQSLAKELAPFGINVNNIAPGLILPEGPEQVGEQSVHYGAGVADEDVLEGVAAGHPTDIASMAVFLASNVSGFISGQTMSVIDGSSQR